MLLISQGGLDPWPCNCGSASAAPVCARRATWSEARACVEPSRSNFHHVQLGDLPRRRRRLGRRGDLLLILLATVLLFHGDLSGALPTDGE